MRDFIVKHFGRILAVLGCSTLVTACYGVPYDEYDPDFNVSGRVVDSEGFFNILAPLKTPPSGFIIECTDVDGELNGSYESVIEEIPYDESHDLIIKMTPKRQ